MWVKFLLWMSPLRFKILNNVIFMLILLLSWIIITNPSDITDLIPITKAYCVEGNEMTSGKSVQLPIENYTPLNDEMEETYDEFFIESQENLNAQITFPRIFPGLSNRMSSRMMGGLTGTLVGFWLTAWTFVDSGINIAPYACDLIDFITGNNR